MVPTVLIRVRDSKAAAGPESWGRSTGGTVSENTKAMSEIQKKKKEIWERRRLPFAGNRP